MNIREGEGEKRKKEKKTPRKKKGSGGETIKEERKKLYFLFPREQRKQRDEGHLAVDDREAGSWGSKSCVFFSFSFFEREKIERESRRVKLAAPRSFRFSSLFFLVACKRERKEENLGCSGRPLPKLVFVAVARYKKRRLGEDDTEETTAEKRKEKIIFSLSLFFSPPLFFFVFFLRS